MVYALFEFSRRIGQAGMHNRRGAVMGDAKLFDEAETHAWVEAAQTHVHTCTGSHRPWETPAIAMKHRQRPQIHGEFGHVPIHDVGNRVHHRAAVVVDHAFGVARGARSVIERNRIPFVLGQYPVVQINCRL